MAHELKRTFRPQQRDIEVLYEDDFGIQKFLYVGLSGPVVVDVDAVIRKHLSEEQELAQNIQRALNGRPPAAEPVKVEPPSPPQAVEAAKPSDPMSVKIAAPRARKGKKGKK